MELAIELSEADIKVLAQPELTAELPEPTIRRVAQLVPITAVPVLFTGASFRVAVFDPADWKEAGPRPGVQRSGGPDHCGGSSARGTPRRRGSRLEAGAHRRQRWVRSAVPTAGQQGVGVVARRQDERRARRRQRRPEQAADGHARAAAPTVCRPRWWARGTLPTRVPVDVTESDFPTTRTSSARTRARSVAPSPTRNGSSANAPST